MHACIHTYIHTNIPGAVFVLQLSLLVLHQLAQTTELLVQLLRLTIESHDN